MFMQSIMNNNATNNNSSINRPRQRLVFHNGYNSPSPPPPSPNLSPNPPPNNSNSNSNTLLENSQDYEEIPSSIQHRLFNTVVEVDTNNLTSNLHNNANTNQYYSNFEYESLNIRFFHNEPLNIQNINDEINNVLASINEREIQNIFNNFQLDENEDFINESMNANDTTSNSDEIIQQITKNTLHGKYDYYKSILKNHSCPILLTDFSDDDIISLFKFCNHAIHESTYEKYSRTFVKCPLCNHKLF